MDEEEQGHITDEEMHQALVAEERLQCPPRPFRWRRVLSEWLDNTGRLLEGVAEYPYALSRAVFGAELHAEDQADFVADGLAEIEKLTGGDSG